MTFEEELRNLAYQSGGSNKTRTNRMSKAAIWANVFSALNIQTKKAKHIHEKQIRQFIEYRKEIGIIPRTLTNDMAAMRVILRQDNRSQFANSKNINNESLGIAGGSRAGKHKAMSAEAFVKLYSDLESYDKGVAICALLAFHLGLRAQEAVQSNQSLKTWEKFLLLGRPVRVIFGTKGGRTRDVRVVDIQSALNAVRAGIALLKIQKKKLINKPNLKEAMNRYKYCMKLFGAVGEFSGHSLRCSFAVLRVDTYVEEGFTIEEAFAQTSMDLGHGDGRGTYIKLVYYKK